MKIELSEEKVKEMLEVTLDRLTDAKNKINELEEELKKNKPEDIVYKCQTSYNEYIQQVIEEKGYSYKDVKVGDVVADYNVIGIITGWYEGKKTFTTGVNLWHAYFDSYEVDLERSRNGHEFEWPFRPASDQEIMLLDYFLRKEGLKRTEEGNIVKL